MSEKIKRPKLRREITISESRKSKTKDPRTRAEAQSLRKNKLSSPGLHTYKRIANESYVNNAAIF